MATTLTLVTITGSFLTPNGRAPSGGMTFQLVLDGVATSIEDSSTGQIVLPQLMQGQIKTGELLVIQPGSNAYGPLQLYANDDPTTRPMGTTYLVKEQLGTFSLTPWTLTVHHTAPTLTISSQRPVAA